MLDFPIADLFDNSLCLLWLERHLHPTGFVCPHCGSSDRRFFRKRQSETAMNRTPSFVAVALLTALVLAACGRLPQATEPTPPSTPATSPPPPTAAPTLTSITTSMPTPTLAPTGEPTLAPTAAPRSDA